MPGGRQSTSGRVQGSGFSSSSSSSSRIVVVVVVVVGPLLASTACSQGFEVGSLKLTWRVRELILKYIYSYIVYS